MKLNEFPQAKSEFSHVVQMVRNHIAKEHFISKFILSVSNSHERLGEAMDRFNVKCQIWRHASSPCFKAEFASPKVYSISHKLMWRTTYVHWQWFDYPNDGLCRQVSLYTWRTCIQIWYFSSFLMNDMIVCVHAVTVNRVERDIFSSYKDCYIWTFSLNSQW